VKRKHKGVVRRTALFLGIGVLAVLAVLPSAGATAPEAAARSQVTLDLSTVAKVKSYLRSVGVDPSGVVIQRGERNYAGPNCPGAGWACTTATKVIQISSASFDGDDGGNQFVCRRDRGVLTSKTEVGSPPNQSCVIVQTGGTRNGATCDMRATGTTGTPSQTCLITQSGSQQNTAVAKQVITMGMQTGEQDVLQRIEVKQSGASSSNAFEGSQLVLLGAAKNAGGADAGAKQDFHQLVCGNQLASGAGSNTAKVAQHGAAGANFSNAGAATIEQNHEPFGQDCTTAGPFADLSGAGHDSSSCEVEGGSGSPKVDANVCARVQQESTGGRNKIDKQDQSLTLGASVTNAVAAIIDQGTYLGGIESTQDQKSSGLSTIVDTQKATQLASVRNVGSANVDQVEDPRCCAGGHQLGNAENTWSITQSLTQRIFEDGQLEENNSQYGSVYGNCTTSGTCSVEQHASNNGASGTNDCTASVCDIFIECYSGEGSECTPSGGGPSLVVARRS